MHAILDNYSPDVSSGRGQWVGALTITFFTRLRAFQFRHVVAPRLAFVAVGDAIDAAHRDNNSSTITDEKACKSHARMQKKLSWVKIEA